ncbi:TAP-like protein [Kordia periserrulae]|uniref:TAP-like protein n=1 Tax=Kordia periserrulae TaxID=701523 RepID=A0A2T6BTN5_9FLAO|nr:alpha/beta hydrolase [Kordia periserrulae]PTX59448.1 TAP-like protein [Kordia periserrulae]
MQKPIILLLLCCVLFSCEKSKEKSIRFTPTFTISTETTHTIPAGQEYTFGYLEVLENREKPAGKTIQLPVYIFKSRSNNPKPDPIIYTVGGPGNSTMRSAQYMKYYQYLDDRDVILFEQRGTEFAKPSLDCPAWSEAIYKSNFPEYNEAKRDSLLEAAARTCRERLIAQGVDLNSYNTNAIAADIEDLRKVLHIEKYNLLTISYSTKIAQVLLRDYPTPIRSVVMDSPLPLEVNYEEESVGNLLEVVTMLLSDCEEDEKCAEKFPNIKNRFFQYLRDATENPLQVTVTNPNTGKPATFHLQGKDLITVFTVTNSNNSAYVPNEIQKLLNNDLSSVKAQLESLFDRPTQFSGSGMGMRLSVWCAEEYPFASKNIIVAEKTTYSEVLGLSPMVFEPNICGIWKVQPLKAIENKAIQSDVPVLLLSGEYDHETPVKWASAMQKNLSNSYHLVFKGWTHTVTTNWGNPCGMEVANAFFNNPNQKPQSKCFEAMQALEFVTE